MTLGLQPVSNSTRPLGCSIRNEGHGRSSIIVGSPPCISSDCGAVSCAPGSAHIFFALPSAMIASPVLVSCCFRKRAAPDLAGPEPPNRCRRMEQAKLDRLISHCQGECAQTIEATAVSVFICPQGC